MAREFWKDTPDGMVTYVDWGLFVSFQAEHQEDMY